MDYPNPAVSITVDSTASQLSDSPTRPGNSNITKEKTSHGSLQTSTEVLAKKSRSLEQRVADFLHNGNKQAAPVVSRASLENLLQQKNIDIASEEGGRLLIEWINQGYIEALSLLLADHRDARIGSEKAVVALYAGLNMLSGACASAAEAFGSIENASVLSRSLIRALAAFDDGNYEAATDKVYQLLVAVQAENGPYKEIPEEERQSWIRDLHWILISCLYETGSVHAALDLCKQFITRPENDMYLLGWFNYGKLQLQLGHLDGAKAVCERIRLKEKEGVNIDFLIVLEGLCAFAESKFDRAFSLFKSFMEKSESSQQCRREVQLSYKMLLWTKNRVPMMIQIYNNMAVCSLHCCRIEEAIALLENAIQLFPYQAIHHVLVFNLCTLYDLARPMQESELAKKVVLAVARKYGIANRLQASDLRLKSL
eukprot:CAMPEP_0184060612 /NCGR_PEP_ID=MMETSP0956-20121227/10893_1 /TAXON_ID=627963 /ORGANISM="Aplanochytrium sp, Strain PBS07" /LENGTH=426 /DNA_ID=CAMNT_0026356695 /DNA_START=72 /DNA_END=1352 /DNA_ORIENTATION=-